MHSFAAGQCWTYRAPPGFETSRIIIGAIVTFEDREAIICCSVLGAPRRLADGSVDCVTIPFLPISAAALNATLVAPDGEGRVPDAFAAALAEWSADAKGLSVFTVPFDGYLDRMIARQMAAIVGLSAA